MSAPYLALHFSRIQRPRGHLLFHLETPSLARSLSSLMLTTTTGRQDTRRKFMVAPSPFAPFSSIAEGKVRTAETPKHWPPACDDCISALELRTPLGGPLEGFIATRTNMGCKDGSSHQVLVALAICVGYSRKSRIIRAQRPLDNFLLPLNTQKVYGIPL